MTQHWLLQRDRFALEHGADIKAEHGALTLWAVSSCKEVTSPRSQRADGIFADMELFGQLFIGLDASGSYTGG